MTTVLDIGGTDPGTHALVIGVGSYDHLLGGKELLLDNPYGLKQLGSPPISALRVAEWLLGSLQNAKAPLASLEVLISAPTPATITTKSGPVEVEPATMANIADAASRWFDRANTNPNNVTFFYHCGHGLQSADLALLAQDFGAPGGDPAAPWARAYNFERSYRGMARCAARAQIYLVDACRQVSADALNFDGQDLQTLVAPKLRGNLLRSAPILYATAREARAFAATDQASRFAAALLTALSSSGMERLNGTWRVTTDSIGKAVRTCIRLGNGPNTPDQECVVSGEAAEPVTLHTSAGNPQVPVIVTAVDTPPSSALEFWRAGEPTPRTTVAGPSPWRHDLVAGTYSIMVRDGQVPIVDLGEDWILPPAYERELA